MKFWRLSLILCFLYSFSASAEWKPHYWNIYSDFSVGYNSFNNNFMINGSANVTMQRLYIGLSYLDASILNAENNHWPFQTNYNFNVGIKPFQNKYLFAV